MAINKIIGSIPYSVGVRIVNPSNADSAKKAYAYVQSREIIDNMLLAQHIKEHGSPFSVGTLRGVIDDVCECISEMLLMGNRVNLNRLGTIYVTLTSTGCDKAEDFTAANIKSVRPRMSFDDDFVAFLQTAEFEYVTSRKAQADAKKTEKQSVNQAIGVISGSDNSGSDDGGNEGGNSSGGNDDNAEGQTE